MATADPTLKAMVLDDLRRAGDIGEGRSRAQLREAVGIGAGDLDRVLDELSANGDVTEAEPDRWEPAGDRWEPEPAAAGEAELPGRPREEAEAPAAAPDVDEPFGGGGAEDKRVELSAGVAGMLDEATLGKIVKAGIDEAAGAGVAFEFVVLP